MIDATFLSKATELAGVQTFTLPQEIAQDGKEHHFSSKPLYEIKSAAPELAKLVSVSTLEGFGELITQRLDELKPEDFLIHIENFAKVSLVKKKTDEYGRRLRLVEATPVPFEVFEFGVAHEQSDFIIGLMSKFSSTSDRNDLVDLAGTVKTDDSATFEDNGITQTITVKKGNDLPRIVTPKPIVQLAPFRIFPEAQQPISDFLFRIDRDGGQPEFTLFEADGGLWKVHAVSSVKKYLEGLALGVEIIA